MVAIKLDFSCYIAIKKFYCKIENLSWLHRFSRMPFIHSNAEKTSLKDHSRGNKIPLERSFCIFVKIHRLFKKTPQKRQNRLDSTAPVLLQKKTAETTYLHVFQPFFSLLPCIAAFLHFTCHFTKSHPVRKALRKRKALTYSFKILQKRKPYLHSLNAYTH